MNHFEFCFFAKEQTWNEGFWVAFLRWYGLQKKDVSEGLDGIKRLNETTYVKSNEPRIPRKTHRVWVTDPDMPTETLDGIKEPKVFEELLNTNRALEKDGHKWTHYLWTNDKKAIPRSVKWFEDNGHIVRELHELPSFDKTIAKIMDEYYPVRFGAAADVARQVIIYDEGGLYLDIDAFIGHWDDQWLYYFDSIYWKDVLKFEELIVFTY